MTAVDRAREEGRRAGLLEAASLIGQRAAKFVGDENALVFATNLRLHLLSLAGPAQARLDDGEDPIDPKWDEIAMRVALVLNAHLEAREQFFREERGSYQRPSFAAELEARREIRAALVRHHETGGDREKWRRESAVLAAGIGIFYAPHLNGELEREKELKRLAVRKLPAGWLPKIYLEPWRPWKLQRGKPDPVPGFAELCFERRRESAR